MSRNLSWSCLLMEHLYYDLGDHWRAKWQVFGWGSYGSLANLMEWNLVERDWQAVECICNQWVDRVAGSPIHPHHPQQHLHHLSCLPGVVHHRSQGSPVPDSHYCKSKYLSKSWLSCSLICGKCSWCQLWHWSLRVCRIWLFRPVGVKKKPQPAHLWDARDIDYS